MLLHGLSKGEIVKKIKVNLLFFYLHYLYLTLTDLPSLHRAPVLPSAQHYQTGAAGQELEILLLVHLGPVLLQHRVHLLLITVSNTLLSCTVGFRLYKWLSNRTPITNHLYQLKLRNTIYRHTSSPYALKQQLSGIIYHIWQGRQGPQLEGHHPPGGGLLISFKCSIKAFQAYHAVYYQLKEV